MFRSNISTAQWAKGAAVALLAFVSLGTVSALWPNPFFMRMTPAGGWEIALLGALAMLSGLYVAMRRPACADRTAGVGGVLGFVGIACPVCNKILLLLFGGELLLTYFQPIRIYVAAVGTAIVAVARRAAVAARPVADACYGDRPRRPRIGRQARHVGACRDPAQPLCLKAEIPAGASL